MGVLVGMVVLGTSDGAKAVGVRVLGVLVGEAVGVHVVGEVVGEAMGVDVVGVAVGEDVGVDVGLSVAVVVGVKVVGVDVGAGVGLTVRDAIAMDGLVVNGAVVDRTTALGVTVLENAVLHPQNAR